jgi:tetratricopeptide (TPR) repeat protein
VFGEQMRNWLGRLDVELPNLLAAHAWCDQAADGATHGLSLVANLRTYWLARGLFALGERVYAEALARPGIDPRGSLRGKVLFALGQHHYVRGRIADAIGPTEESLSIAREHGDAELIVYCLDRLSLACGWLGQVERARKFCDEEMAVAKRTGSHRLQAFALTAEAGVCRIEGNFDAAAAAYEEALPLFDLRGRPPQPP